MYGNRGRLETVQRDVSKKASVRCSSICLYEILTDGGALQSRHENLKNLLYGLEPYLNNAGRKKALLRLYMLFYLKFTGKMEDT